MFLVLFLLFKGTAKSIFFNFLCVVGVVFCAYSGRSRSNSAVNNN